MPLSKSETHKTDNDTEKEREREKQSEYKQTTNQMDTGLRHFVQQLKVKCFMSSTLPLVCCDEANEK